MKSLKTRGRTAFPRAGVTRMRAIARAASLGMLIVAAAAAGAAPARENAPSRHTVLVNGAHGEQLRLTAYGQNIVRIQSVRAGEKYFDDHHYEMVASHDYKNAFRVSRRDGMTILRLDGPNAIELDIDQDTLAIRYFIDGRPAPVLQERGGVEWQGQVIRRRFAFDDHEHFTALGHSYFGRSQSIDLKGQSLTRNYGAAQIDQAPLLVPFYISSKGYGVFLNSTFKNFFNFGKDGDYEFGIDTLGFDGRMDYFFIAGPQPKDVLAHYVELTGKPRLPAKAMFGLALSDKSHDHDSPTPSDEAWWKQKIMAHRAAGFPLDHVVNDNRWRAGGGKRCESYIEWDKGRYPDPREYQRWLKANGLVSTLDFNRCVAQYSEGWRRSFNLPEPGKIDFAQSAPDLTNPAFRKWFWDILYKKSLDPALHYPGDALWIDEFDEQGAAPETMILANGLSSAEMRNYWFFLISKALVQQGWDTSAIKERPYVWVRGMTAGAQRYATLWSGDIKPNFDEMKMQIRGMQLAGLSGFPYWGHDAGGFYDWTAKTGPDAELYMKWSMAFGSFAPIWKPHGAGPSRWPLDRSGEEQAVAHRFARLRYELMPYMYSAAHEAASTGMPIARAMLLAYPEQEKAWQYDLQYMWGPSLLVAPFTSADQVQDVWLPPGQWFDYWRPQHVLQGDTVIPIKPDANEIALFVKAGSIIPGQAFALSTRFADKSMLRLDVYGGADGDSQLIEDDDTTEDYRLHGRQMTTAISYRAAAGVLHIGAARGDYAGAPAQRSYRITLHGVPAPACFTINGIRATEVQTSKEQETQIVVPKTSVRKDLTIAACR
ncbi:MULTISPECIES: TIM-barrel domain-containing protein [unclassified Massilia]|uniref:glycoside hydrolase family 31 protein n=1 Tax=unclassified Massilia TaxID=2609279 RepID=UPI000B231479|nr:MULTISPECIES: TIM-barrel domain-containing protein [unclassified Massilia]